MSVNPFVDLGEDRERLIAAGVDPDAVRRAADALIGALAAGGALLTCGNGGSAADAQHVAAELVGRFEKRRPGLPAVALGRGVPLSDAIVLANLAAGIVVGKVGTSTVDASELGAALRS